MYYLSGMKPIHKFNNGRGATLCNECSVIIHTGKPSNAMLCNKHLEEYIYSFPTKYKEGFTQSEVLKLVYDLRCGRDKYFDKLGIHTGMAIDGEDITYHDDVLLAVKCALENRSPTVYEWD